MSRTSTRLIERVHHEHPLEVGIVGDDLGGGLVERAGLVAAEEGQLQPRGADRRVLAVYTGRPLHALWSLLAVLAVFAVLAGVSVHTVFAVHAVFAGRSLRSFGSARTGPALRAILAVHAVFTRGSPWAFGSARTGLALGTVRTIGALGAAHAHRERQATRHQPCGSTNEPGVTHDNLHW